MGEPVTLADDVAESIVNARRIDKIVRSTSPHHRRSGDKLYIIKGSTHDGTRIYSKGTIVREASEDEFYILVSAERSIDQ